VAANPQTKPVDLGCDSHTITVEPTRDDVLGVDAGGAPTVADPDHARGGGGGGGLGCRSHGLTEIAGLDIDGRVKKRGWTLQDWTMKD